MSEYIYEHKPSGADHMGKPVELPTLVQREEIVRCRDCKHFNGFACEKFACTYCGELQRVEEDGFCALGERKEKE